MNSTVLCIAGLPGSGKSTAAEYLQSNGVKIVRIGDIVRDLAGDAGISLENGEAIGKWASQQREQHGKTVFAERTAQKISSIESPRIGVDGIRSVGEVEVFREQFPSVYTLFVTAPQEVRYKRIVNRGRDTQESEFTLEEFKQRDNREKDWGVTDVKAEADFVLQNTESKDKLHTLIDQILTLTE